MSRSLESGNVSGGEGVRIALVEAWLHEKEIRKQVEGMANKARDESRFQNFYDKDLGHALLQGTELVSDFFAWVASDPKTMFMSDMAGVNLWSQRHWVSEYLSTDFGAHLKKYGWFDRNRRTLEKFRKQIRTVQKVMEE